MRLWNSRPKASSVFSLNAGPTSCSATGMFSEKPQGRHKRRQSRQIPRRNQTVHPAYRGPGLQSAGRRSVQRIRYFRSDPVRGWRDQHVDVGEQFVKSLLDQGTDPHRLQIIFRRNLQTGLQSRDLLGIRQFIHFAARDQRLENRRTLAPDDRSK